MSNWLQLALHFVIAIPIYTIAEYPKYQSETILKGKDKKRVTKFILDSNYRKKSKMNLFCSFLNNNYSVSTRKSNYTFLKTRLGSIQVYFWNIYEFLKSDAFCVLRVCLIAFIHTSSYSLVGEYINLWIKFQYDIPIA